MVLPILICWWSLTLYTGELVLAPPSCGRLPCWNFGSQQLEGELICRRYFTLGDRLGKQPGSSLRSSLRQAAYMIPYSRGANNAVSISTKDPSASPPTLALSLSLSLWNRAMIRPCPSHPTKMAEVTPIYLPCNPQQPQPRSGPYHGSPRATFRPSPPLPRLGRYTS